jgi:hypothetical protein
MVLKYLLSAISVQQENGIPAALTVRNGRSYEAALLIALMAES